VLVIPTFNEGRYITEILDSSDKILSKLFDDYKIVVVDASTDNATKHITNKFIAKNKRIAIIRRNKRGQRGLDVIYAMSQYKSRLYFYIDADLTPSLRYLRKAIKEYDKGYQLVLGSRYLDRRLLKRPKLRKMVSLGYNKMIRIMFGDQIKDHQCGFKLFDENVLSVIKEKGKEKHWAWDTEMILITYYNKFRIKEIPIRWVERRSDVTSLKRLIKDISLFLPSILSMLYRFRILRDYNTVK
jgi:glycosyltransferase involved in cell wall biosynthesis